LIQQLPPNHTVFLLGAPSDLDACQYILEQSARQEVHNVAGQLSLLGSAALMQNAKMNFVNDSAPMHLASSVNAPVTAIFCSTIPAFGFTPLSDNSKIMETSQALSCRPCGLHGYSKCPKGHFACAESIEINVHLNQETA
jgi:heptosyltransferase-2